MLSLLLIIYSNFVHINANFTHCNNLCSIPLYSTVDIAEPSKLRITRPNGPELSSPVVVGTSQTLSIWCTAVNTDSPGRVQGLHWRFPNNSRVPKVSINDEYDVGMFRYRENNMWIGILRINGVQESLAGIYTCVANFSGMPKNRSMEIQVTGGCPIK